MNWRYLQIGRIWRYLQINCRYLQMNWRYLQIGLFGDICNSIADIFNSIGDISNSIADMCTSIGDIFNSVNKCENGAPYVRSVRLAIALLMSDGAISASTDRLLVFVGFRHPVIIRLASFSVVSLHVLCVPTPGRHTLQLSSIALEKTT